MDIRRRLRRLAKPWSRSHSRASTTNVPDSQQWASAGDTANDRGEVDSDESTGGWLATESRSQSEVLGTILILGLSMTAIGIALAGGGVALGDLISDAEASNVENGMSHLSSKASLVALGDADTQRFSLGTTQEGTVSVQPNEGSMTITNVTNESRDEVFETDLGAIVYEGKNREVAYQGGGIWTKRGENSTMTSPPEYYYRGTTLTLPVIQVTGEGAVGGQASGQITPVDVAQDAVAGLPKPLEEGTIEIKIQSEYYEGWYQFLSARTAGETEIYHGNNTVVSTLTVPDEVTFNNALSVQSSYNAKGNADIDPVEENVPHRSAKPLIASEVESANESGTDWFGNGPLTGEETYFADGDLTLKEDLEIDLSSGNVTIVVDGTFDLDGNDITVTNAEDDNRVTYFVNGSIRAQGNSELSVDNGDPDIYEPERNIFYVADEVFDESKGGGTISFEAIIYAPDADIESAGTVDIYGSVVANSIDVKGDFNIEYVPSVASTTVELTGAADLLRYLHVSHNKIRVELN